MASLFGELSKALTSLLGDPREDLNFKSQDKLVKELRKREEAERRRELKALGKTPRKKAPHRAKATVPMDIFFRVPKEASSDASSSFVEGSPGHRVAPRTLSRVVCVSGPHGPLSVELPDDAKPGEEVRVRIGPTAMQAVVPPGFQAGDHMAVQLASGSFVQVQIPPGVEEGETFDFAPPVSMVQVPPEAEPGDLVSFHDPFRHQICEVRVPTGQSPGAYFAVTAECPEQLFGI